MVRQGEKPTHKCSRTEGSFPGPERVQGPVSESDCVGSDRQLNSGSLHKQARRNPVSRHVCPPDLVPSLQNNPTFQAHPRVPEFDGQCYVQVKSDPINRMITSSAGIQTDLPKVVHSSCRPFCHSSEPQVSSVRVSSPRLTCLGHRYSEHKLYGSCSLCVPSHSSPLQGDAKNQAILLLHHTNSPRLARDALVLGPSAALSGDATPTTVIQNTSQTASQSGVSQQPSISEPPHLVSRSGRLQEQGFSVEVAEIIGAPQRSSTRTVYKSKWALFEKWCRENMVDFSTPSVKQVSDFLMYMNN